MAEKLNRSKTAMLTQKQERFVQLLLSGKSQRQAYREAYPNCKATDKTVDEKASKLLSEGKVRARYEELRDKVMSPLEEQAIATAQEVLIELTNMAFARKEYESYDAQGNRYSVKPTIAQRQRALELLGKAHRLFTENINLGNREGEGFQVEIKVVE